MRHPTEGVLRRVLDEPAAVGIDDRDHIAACGRCREALEVIREDAAMAARALGVAAADVDVSDGWRRLSMAAADTKGARTTSPSRFGGLRDALRRPAAAGIALAVVLAGAGTAAANDWFQIFRTEQVAPVSIATADLNALPDLRAYGDVTVIAEPDVHPVADAAAAAAETGIDVPEVGELPRGVTGEPAYRAGGEAVIEFTFSAERAARTAGAAGETLPPPPPGLDGSRVRLVAGPGVAMTWTKSGGIPVLLVGRAVAPSALSSSGVPFETMRDYLLSMPGLPENIAAPLRTFNTDGSTLPLPVPDGYVTTSESDVGGEPATVLTTRDGATSAVVWVEDGVMTVVAGSINEDEVLAVARGIR